MDIVFRKARHEDLPDILHIIADARAFLASQHLDQWQNGYPNEEAVAEDICRGQGYVVCLEGRPAATAALILGREPDYDVIADGHWGADGPYAAIHRVAIRDDLRGGGLARRLFQELEALCRQARVFSIRIDTHPGNLPMQRFLSKCGFVQRGCITLSALSGDEGALRNAYDKILPEYSSAPPHGGARETAVQLGEVALLTSDVPRLAAFYKTLLGIDNHSEDEVHQFLLSGPVALTVYNDGTEKSNQNQNIGLAFTVADVDKEYPRLLSLGAPVLQPPQTQPWGARNMVFLDPDGNRVVFRCFPAQDQGAKPTTQSSPPAPGSR